MQERFETFTTQILKINRCIRKIKNFEVAQYNLKGTQVICLYYLYKEGENMTSKKLCELCDEDKASVSRALDYLNGEEYIVCQSKTKKPYNSPISLTEKGKEVGVIIAEKVDRLLSNVGKGLSEENREVFYKSLLTISDNLQKICENYESKHK